MADLTWSRTSRFTRSALRPELSMTEAHWQFMLLPRQASAGCWPDCALASAEDRVGDNASPIVQAALRQGSWSSSSSRAQPSFGKDHEPSELSRRYRSWCLSRDPAIAKDLSLRLTLSVAWTLLARVTGMPISLMNSNAISDELLGSPLAYLSTR